ALQYAHNLNVIHRDIKPENILLGSSQNVMLSDFGIALFSPSPELLSTQDMAGTLPYMAPEQLRGKPGFASDQYSLGVVVYEWLCGVRPFEGSYWQIATQHVSASPPSMREKARLQSMLKQPTLHCRRMSIANWHGLCSCA
ncbi:MAG TPA: protein kinase, partial [Ktedonobacteraceae bacterium]